MNLPVHKILKRTFYFYTLKPVFTRVANLKRKKKKHSLVREPEKKSGKK